MTLKKELLFLGTALAGAFYSSAAFSEPPANNLPIDEAGTAVVGYAGAVASLDPHRMVNSGEPIFTQPIYDRLTTTTNSLEVKPMLAESWEFKDNGAILEMKLRKDVKFKDGTRFDAAAVKANIERGKTLDRSSVVVSLQVIKDVKIIDDFTVQFVLEDGVGANLPALFSTNAGMMISPKAIGDPSVDLTLNPQKAGSGPYIPTAFTVNESVTLVRAPNHWDKNAGKLATMRVQSIPPAAARFNGMQAGQLNVAQITGGDIVRAQQLSQKGVFSSVDVTTFIPEGLFMRADRDALKDIRIRQAIVQAIDKEGIKQANYNGACEVATQPVPKVSWAYNKDLEKVLTYNPEKAKALVAEVGGKPSLEIVFTSGTPREVNANLVQGMLKQVGITAKLTPMPSTDGINALRVGKTDSMMHGLATSADPGVLIGLLYLGGYNLIPEESRAELAKLAADGVNPKRTNDQRVAAYHQLFRKVTEAVYMVPICFNQHVWAFDKNLVGVPEADGLFNGTPDLRYLARVKR